VDDVTATHAIFSVIRWGRHLLACAILAMPLAFAAQANAGQPRAIESSDPVLRVKAAYLYKFAGYVDWPPGVFASEDSPIVVGVIGNDDLEGVLSRMVVGKTVNGRPLMTRRLKAGSSLHGVHILFVGALDKPTLRAIGDAARGKPVLVVSGARQQRMLDSMISFDLIGQHLRFNVALEPAATSGLKLRALMLTAAARVTRAADEK
jgi:hypothetical protein